MARRQDPGSQSVRQRRSFSQSFSQKVGRKSVSQSVSQSGNHRWLIVAVNGQRSQRQVDKEGNHSEKEVVHAQIREGVEVLGGLSEVVREVCN